MLFNIFDHLVVTTSIFFFFIQLKKRLNLCATSKYIRLSPTTFSIPRHITMPLYRIRGQASLLIRIMSLKSTWWQWQVERRLSTAISTEIEDSVTRANKKRKYLLTSLTSVVKGALAADRYLYPIIVTHVFLINIKRRICRIDSVANLDRLTTTREDNHCWRDGL